MRITTDHFEAFRPKLEEDVIRSITYQFDRIMEAVPENSLITSMSLAKKSRTLEEYWRVIRDFVVSDVQGGGAVRTYHLNTARLQKYAAEVASASIQSLVSKLDGKLGDHLDVVEVLRNEGGFVTIKGRLLGDIPVYVDQKKILNVSSQGKLFHQWPALLYVDGKKVSEAKFRQLMQVASA